MFRWRQGAGLGGGVLAILAVVGACSESEPRSSAGGAGSRNASGGSASGSRAGGQAGRAHAGEAGAAAGGALTGGIAEAGRDGGGAPPDASDGGVGGGDTGDGGAPGGAGGAGDSLGGIGPEAGATSAPTPLIDDFEDKDNGLEKLEGRDGYWFTTTDTHGSTITPTPNSTGATPLKPGTTNCHAGSMACVIVSGTTVATDVTNLIYPYAGVGFAFMWLGHVGAYNASGTYSGIKLWARGNAAVRIGITTVATASPSGGGTCAANCGSHGVSALLTNNWQEITLPFATIQQEDWSTPVPFDPAKLLGLTVLFPAGTTFDAAFDDVTFY